MRFTMPPLLVNSVLLCLLSALVAPIASAATYTVEVCAKFDTSFAGATSALDFWGDNSTLKKARGVWIEVSDHGSGTYIFDGWSGEESGCTSSLTLTDDDSYSTRVYSKAKVEGIEMYVWSSSSQLYLLDAVDSNWVPTSSGKQGIIIPAGSSGNTPQTAFGQLAVGTWIFNRSQFGLASGEVFNFENDDCCNTGDAAIRAASSNMFIISHEIGHAIFRRRDGGGPNDDYGSAMFGCTGDQTDRYKHGNVSREFQSSAASEGFADFVAAWAFNRRTESDCTYNRHYVSDFDLNGTPDTASYSCEGVPITLLEPWVSGTDWLEDAVNGSGPACSASLVGRSTQYDWLRFLWDMTSDEDVTAVEIADLYDAMDMKSVDATGSQTLPVTDDVLERFTLACSSQGLTTECNDRDNNGQDH